MVVVGIGSHAGAVSLIEPEEFAAVNAEARLADVLPLRLDDLRPWSCRPPARSWQRSPDHARDQHRLHPARMLREDEGWLHVISIERMSRHGALWVYRDNDDAILAFTGDGIDDLSASSRERDASR